MQTFRIIAENPSHENAASKLVPAAVRFFILAVLIRFKQHSAPPYETTFLPFFSLPSRFLPVNYLCFFSMRSMSSSAQAM